jgi:chemotaxis protein CheX
MNAVAAAKSFEHAMFRPFFLATDQVIQMMTGASSTMGAPYRKRDPYKMHDIAGQIMFYGDVMGTATICLPGETADRLVAAFAGRILPRDSADYCDAVGELSNMIAGAAKRLMPGVSHITTPNVIVGHHTVAPAHGVPCIAIPVSCQHGEFTVEVCIKRTEKRKEKES